MKKLRIIAAVVAVSAVGSLGVAQSATASPSAPTLQYGSTGNGVKCVQWALNYHYGNRYPALTNDGIFGTATKSRVQTLQAEANGAIGPVDGIVGKATGTAIYTDDVKGAPSSWNCYANATWRATMLRMGIADLGPYLRPSRSADGVIRSANR